MPVTSSSQLLGFAFWGWDHVSLNLVPSTLLIDLSSIICAMMMEDNNA